jgi:hypothetical protein
MESPTSTRSSSSLDIGARDVAVAGRVRVGDPVRLVVPDAVQA